MSHLYLHIPFCKQKCHYCDFYSIGNLNQKTEFIDALCREVELQADYLKNHRLETIYFGGGTPSVLSGKELLAIFESIEKHYAIANDCEITMECNPDDLTEEYIKMLQQTPVNRISIGAQSFDDRILSYLNRRHNAEQTIKAVKTLQENDFNNLSLDLIFGIPNQSLEQWESDLQLFLDLKIPHLSAYLLTVEEQTMFGKWQRNGTLTLPSAEASWEKYNFLNTFLNDNGYKHYEISNYAKRGFHSRHNSAYWQQESYLGLGPSAHSFNGISRQWNEANVRRYIQAVLKNNTLKEIEYLSKKDKYNDFIITRLRTANGFRSEEIKTHFSDYETIVNNVLEKYQGSDLLKTKQGRIALTEKGFFVSDSIMLDFIAE